MPDPIFFISEDCKRKTWLTLWTLPLINECLYKYKLKNCGVVLLKSEDQSCIQKPEFDTLKKHIETVYYKSERWAHWHKSAHMKTEYHIAVIVPNWLE